MLSEVDKRVIAGFAAAFLLLVLTMYFSYRNMSQFRSISFEVAHTHQVLFQIEQIFADLIEIESNQRGLLIYNDQAFKNNYLEGTKSIEVNLDTLQQLTLDNKQQLARIDTLRKLIAQKIAFASSFLDDSVRNRTTLASGSISLRGKRLTDAIKRVSEEMKAEEKRLLNKRVALANAANRQFHQLYIAFGFVIIIIFICILYIIRSRMKERLEAESILQLRSDEIKDLYDNAPCGYHSLDERGNVINVNNTLLQWLGYSKEEVLYTKRFSELMTEESRKLFEENFEIFKQQGHLDGVEYTLSRSNGTEFQVILNARAIYDQNGAYVKSRSTTFDITDRKEAEERVRFLNSELEAFSYSVSHDLRAPLRSIDSYTKILLEDHAKDLDEEAKRIVGVVLKNTKRMGLLIDDLLDFSRVGRKELVKSGFSMTRLVQGVMDQLEIETVSDRIKVINEIATDGWGDKNMISQVWLNLFSNALKYASREEKIRIRLGSFVDDRFTVFFIEDNGVGFDMAYYDRLFGVFQRLHTSKEFEGTGVGLALSHRIVSRHGGEMWAESEQGKGATFYFSLPGNQ